MMPDFVHESQALHSVESPSRFQGDAVVCTTLVLDPCYMENDVPCVFISCAERRS